MEWINVEDRLPTQKDANLDFSVLANHKASKKQYWHYISVVDNPFDFTSWMPVPKSSEEVYK